MKKILVFICLCILSCALIGCTTETQPDDIPNNPATNQENDDFEDIINSVEEIFDDPEENTIGSRLNPASLGDTLLMTISSYSYNGNIAIKMAETISGQDAWNLIQEMNSYNDPAPEGSQYLMAKFEITFEENTAEKDLPIELSKFNFEYASSSFSVSDIPSVTQNDSKPYTVKLYEGATGELWVPFLISDSETAAYAIFLDTAWFQLV